MKKRKLRKLTALILSLAFVLSLTACGKDEKASVSGKKLNSIFDFFNEKIEPTTGGIDVTTEQHTGDVVVDPSVIDPPSTDPNEYADTENEELNKLFHAYFEEYVTENYMTYHDYIVNGKDFNITPPATVSWGDAGTSNATLEEDKKHIQDWISKFEAIDVKTLTEQQRFDYDYVLESLKAGLISFENINIGSSFSPMRGLQANLPSSFTDFVFRNKADVDAYLQLMNDVPRIIDDCLKIEQEHVDAGYALEDCVIDKIISQCDEFLNVKGSEHFLIGNFDDTIDTLDFLTAAEKTEYKKKDRDAVNNSMLPTYKKIKEFFTGCKGKNKIKGGLVNYQDHGKELYEYVVREYSGSAKTPAELITYLEEKQTKLQMEMAKVYQKDPDGFSYYQQNSKTLFNYLSDMDAQQLVDYLMKNAMGDFPEMDPIKYKALYFSKSMEEIKDSTLAYYLLPALDDPDGNLIRVNGKHKDGMWITLAHEGCPGHMYQTNYYRRTNPDPVRMIGNDLGYMEGWAVYSSYQTLKKCDFNGSQYAETLGELTRIEESLGYLYYGRIDLGVNYEGWTLEDVKGFLRKLGLNENAAEELYVIFVGDPGVYLSYSVGYFEMQDLRDYAEEQLGDKFNAVDYHAVILNAGPCKYDQLKKRVDKYILEQK